MEELLAGYLEMGWRIFPCHSIVDGRCTCGKADCGSPGKHPRTRQGVKDATSDPAVVRRWWTQWPDANPALACGRDSDVIVIDIDRKKGGYEAIDAYEAARLDGPLPVSLRALTGGGGQHFFYRYPSSGVQVPNRVNWLSGVDVRSDGGYVILPPGSHISGGRYDWRNWGSAVVELPVDVALDISAGGSSASAMGINLKDTAGILNGVPEGLRDDTLFRWACSLRRKHAGDEDGGRAVVTTLVLAAAERSGFPRDEALKKVEQAFRQDHSDEVQERRLHPPTDLGNRDRFVDLHGEDVLYLPERGWMAWTDRGWSPVPVERILRMIESVPAAIGDELSTLQDPVQRKRWAKHLEASQQAGSLAAVERLARQHPNILRSFQDFDANLTELACANGIVDLRTGELRPYSRADLVTRNTGTAYAPRARMDEWDRFLQTSTQGDQELIDYLQLAAGYTATGLNSQECFFVISGAPASGKSTYVDALMAALGSYATTSQSDTFMYRRGKDAPKDELARLAGLRMVSVSEIREGDVFNEALVKQITGGDPVQARFLYKDGFTYVPQFKLWIATNHDPLSSDRAMLRRIKRIQFQHVVPVEDRDPRLKELLKTAGREAVLAWIVEGARRFLESGVLREPATVTAAVGEYQLEQDVFGMFVKDSLRVVPGERVYFVELFAAWKGWADRLGQPVGKMAPFRHKLSELGLKIELDRDGREYYQDLTLNVLVPAGW